MARQIARKRTTPIWRNEWGGGNSALSFAHSWREFLPLGSAIKEISSSVGVTPVIRRANARWKYSTAGCGVSSVVAPLAQQLGSGRADENWR